MEVVQRQPFLLDASRRIGLHLFDQSRDRQRAMQVAENVYMVLHDTDDQRRAFDIPQNPNHVSRHDSAEVWCAQIRRAVFCAEHEVDQDV
jgi:hypothetical protein